MFTSHRTTSISRRLVRAAVSTSVACTAALLLVLAAPGVGHAQNDPAAAAPTASANEQLESLRKRNEQLKEIREKQMKALGKDGKAVATPTPSASLRKLEQVRQDYLEKNKRDAKGLLRPGTRETTSTLDLEPGEGELLLAARGFSDSLKARARRVPAGGVKVLPGVDVLLSEKRDLVRGKRVGLLTNPSGSTWDGIADVDALADAKDFQLVAIFGPEHGVRGEVFAGKKVDNTSDTLTGISAYSLYGKSKKPTKAQLAKLDVLLYDIQDTGNRSYTFIASMYWAMQACKEHGKKFVVLDRPEPFGGNLVDGNVLNPQEGTSDVGLTPIAYLYGMTPGEIARYYNEELGIGCDLEVVPMRGWRRGMSYEETGLLWVPPSQHVPYPMSCYFMAMTGTFGELHRVSEGVGTPMPFECVGAPWIKETEFAAALNKRRIPGVFFRPTIFTPRYGVFKDKLCRGVQIHIEDASVLKPVTAGLDIMAVLQELYPEHKPLGATDDKDTTGSKRVNMFGKVMGSKSVLPALRKGTTGSDLSVLWEQDLAKFRAIRQKYLMY